MANQSVPGDYQDGYQHARLALMYGPRHAEYRYETSQGRRSDSYLTGFLAALQDHASNRPVVVDEPPAEPSTRFRRGYIDGSTLQAEGVLSGDMYGVRALDARVRDGDAATLCGYMLALRDRASGTFDADAAWAECRSVFSGKD